MSGREFVHVEIPAWASWGQRCGVVLPRRRGVGPNGRQLCRWCDRECEPPRICWCSDECVREYGRVWSWDAMRKYVIERDNETCQRCGTTDPSPPPERERALWEGGPVIKSRHRSDPWDVDHIVRVIDGGTDDPANLRLLCMACHVEVGHEQRAASNGQAALDLRPTPHTPSASNEPSIGEMRAAGADVVHLSVGAAGHARPWYCSASRKGPPPLSECAVGDSADEAANTVLAKVRGWPPVESPDATEVTPGPAGPTVPVKGGEHEKDST